MGVCASNFSPAGGCVTSIIGVNTACGARQKEDRKEEKLKDEHNV